MSQIYQNLDRPAYQLPGIAERVWGAPVHWFAPNGIAVPVPPFDDAGDRVLIRANHQFIDEDKGFIEFQLAPEANLYDARSIGGRETQKLEHSLTIFLPGSYSALHDMMAGMLNVPFIFLVRDSTCEGKMFYQLGNPVDYCWLQADFTTSTSAEGRKGYACRYTWISTSLLIYQGAPQIIEGDPDFDPANFLFTDFKTI